MVLLLTLLSSAAADLALTDIPSPSATSPGAAQPADSPKPPTPIPRRSRPASLPRLRRRQQADSSPGSRPTPALSAAPAPSEEASGPSGVGRGGRAGFDLARLLLAHLAALLHCEHDFIGVSTAVLLAFSRHI